MLQLPLLSKQQVWVHDDKIYEKLQRNMGMNIILGLSVVVLIMVAGFLIPPQARGIIGLIQTSATQMGLMPFILTFYLACTVFYFGYKKSIQTRNLTSAKVFSILGSLIWLPPILFTFGMTALTLFQSPRLFFYLIESIFAHFENLLTYMGRLFGLTDINDGATPYIYGLPMLDWYEPIPPDVFWVAFLTISFWVFSYAIATTIFFLSLFTVNNFMKGWNSANDSKVYTNVFGNGISVSPHLNTKEVNIRIYEIFVENSYIIGDSQENTTLNFQKLQNFSVRTLSKNGEIVGFSVFDNQNVVIGLFSQLNDNQLFNYEMLMVDAALIQFKEKQEAFAWFPKISQNMLEIFENRGWVSKRIDDAVELSMMNPNFSK